MRVSSALRTTAVVLALGVCAMLLGLSYAQHALPGDTFQVARTASVVAAAPGAEAPQGRKLPKAHENPTDGQLWFVTLPDIAATDPPPGSTAGSPVAVTVHGGRCVGTPGCRGPPTS